jgi:peptidoglycan/LPS O-acetylase OafA/YrhL
MFRWKTFDTFEAKSNNFALIRVIAAIAVCYGHSFALSPGSGQQDLFILNLSDANFYTGSLAVCVFLFISGALVSASLLRLQSPLDFLIHRVARIYPALIVSILITAACVFALYPSVARLRDLGTWGVLNATGFTNSWQVPGVFEKDTTYTAINGSLWTIPLEVRCYLILLLAGIVFEKITRQKLLFVHIVCLFLSFASPTDLPLVGSNPATLGNAGYHEYLIFFSLGGIAYSMKAGNLSMPVLATCAFGTWIFWSFVAHNEFWIAVSISFFVLLASKSLLLQKIRIKSDLSYGLYLYAWPMAQFVNQFFPTALPLEAFLITLLATVPLAWFSWVFVEKPSIAFGKNLVRTASLRIRKTEDA